jgi:hypothetical protein
MKKILITIVMVTFLAALPVVAEGIEDINQANGVAASSFYGHAPAAPSFGRRHRRRMRRRHMRIRRRHYRRVMRRRRMRM